ncbi:AI-2E family transporter [Ottowia sp.]|uniref:AI-2E family transporter n=1 Tax=Ottowia sp. TaxID=1898956 RepID=UPI002C1F9750|nr:AI-2E family transporter [Ottowia sp.]HOB67990.1 AI-2E family transporter [Ottowia sp.]HPZ55836.1 AI-2E family transporter [Ottowia sp.]HQD48895.1 AI-2E family transporter [Ottowia sp.]
MNTPAIQRAFFLLLLAAVTLAFFGVLAPFFGAVFWAIVFALLFHGMFRRLRVSLRGRDTLAALLTLAFILLLVVVPMVLVGGAMVNEIATFSQRVRAGEIDFRGYYQQILNALPAWLTDLAGRFGVLNVRDVLDKLSGALTQGGQEVATRALQIGQNTLLLVVNLAIMLYLLFFLLRDGQTLARLLRDHVPLAPDMTEDLSRKFATVVRATVKGSIVVAMVQGFLGGLALWVLGIHGAVLWGALMALLSLVPAVGAALIWAPVAIYLIATGATWQGVGLIAWGTLVIGMVDNLLRPILVGKDTKLPDYVVLLSTIGGISAFGINGFVIGPVIAALFVATWTLFNREHDAQAEPAPAGEIVQHPDDL